MHRAPAPASPAEVAAEYEAAGAARNKIERTIIETPAVGAAGLAIKSYLAIHLENGSDEDAPAIGGTNTGFEAGVLEDIVRFVPEIAPLAVDALKEPSAEKRLVETVSRLLPDYVAPEPADERRP